MAAILEWYPGEKALVLGNEQYIRPFGFGYNWSRLRIVLRCGFYTSSTTNVNLSIGVTREGRGMFAANSDCAGVRWTQNMSYSSGPPRLTWEWGPNYALMFSRVNNVDNTAGVGNTGLRNLSVYPVFNALGADIRRNTDTSIDMSHIDSPGIATLASASFSATREAILNDMARNTMSNTNFVGEESPSTLSGYTGSGLWDCLLIRHNLAAQPLVITDIFVYRMY